MIGLAIETATLQGSLAVFSVEDGKAKILASQTWHRQRSHGELITPTLEDLLRISDTTLDQIEFLALDIGPGSFTGIRVGLNLAKSLSYAKNLPVWTCTSLEVLAHQVPIHKSTVYTLINAHKNQSYFARFVPAQKSWKFALKPRAVDPKGLQKCVKQKGICVGEGYEVFKDSLSASLKKNLVRSPLMSDFPHAESLARLSAVGFLKARLKTWKQVEALYIRGSEAEEKLKAGSLKPLPKF